MQQDITTWKQFFKAGYGSTYLIICFGIWLHAANSLLTATTISATVAEIGGLRFVGWAFALYLVGSIMAGASAGTLARRLNLKQAYITGAGLFLAGCLACALAPHLAVFLVGRTVQGFGGGLLVAMAYLTASRFFPASFFAKPFAWISAIWSVSAFSAPMIGGLFAANGLWRLAYGSFALQALIMMGVTILVLKSDVPLASPSTKKFPLRRIPLLVLAVLAIAAAGIAPEDPSTSWLILAGLGLLALFLWLDRAAADASMLPVDLANPFSITGQGALLIFFLGFSTMSFLAFGPLLLENLHGLSPLEGGYVVALESIAWGLSTILVSQFYQGDPRYLIRIGPFLIIGALLGFTFAMPGGPFWVILLASAASGAGFGIMWPQILQRLTAFEDPEGAPVSTMIPTLQQLAFAIGAASAGMVANAAGLGQSPEGLANAAVWLFAAFLPFALVGLMAGSFFTSRRHESG